MDNSAESSADAAPNDQVASFVFEGTTVRFFVDNPSDEVQSHHLKGEFYEQEELEIIRRYATNGGVFCDIGCNVGNHTVFAALFLGASQVIAFEPNPAASRIAEKNIALNNLGDRVVLHRVGLSDVSQTASLGRQPKNNLGGTMLNLEKSGDIVIRSATEMLGDVNIGFVKIDVEGMEFEVLKGLSPLLKHQKPPIFVEASRSRRLELRTWCAENGYIIAERFRRYRGVVNYMLTPAETLQEAT